MTSERDPELARAIATLAVPGVLIDHRLIAPGDELALLPSELEPFAHSVLKVKQASGAARIAARSLLSRWGYTHQPVPRSGTGAPVWPDAIVGSLAHDNRVAIAAIARRSAFQGLGIDVEPAEQLDPELLDLVATTVEQRRIAQDPLGGRLLFAVKEAVYKAVHPLDGEFLDHHDVEIDLTAQRAAVRGGRSVQFRYCTQGGIVALAFL